MLDVLSIFIIYLPYALTGELYVRKSPRHQRVDAGDSVTLNCEPGLDTSLTSDVSIVWHKHGLATQKYRDKIPVGEDDNDDRVATSDRGQHLTLNSVTSKDTGLYTCTLSYANDTTSASAQLIVEDVPDPPEMVKLVSCENRVAQIHWSNSRDNFSPVIQFIIEYNTSFNPLKWTLAKRQSARSSLLQRITLSPWAKYSFRVTAVNRLGKSRPSIHTSEDCTMDPDVPHLNPSGVCTKNTRPGHLVITWNLVSLFDQNAPGFHYLVKWRRKSSKTKKFRRRIVVSSKNFIVIKNQPYYKAYDIFVISINQIGEAVSTPKMMLGYSSENVPLEIPRNVHFLNSYSIGSDTSDLVWNHVNTSSESMQGFFRGYLIEYWKTDDLNRSSLRKHRIVYEQEKNCWHQKQKSRYTDDNANGQIYNLWPYTNISLTVRVMNDKYVGKPSKEIEFTTKEGVPTKVKNLKVLRKGMSFVYLTWEPPDKSNGVITGYTISYHQTKPDLTLGTRHYERRVDESATAWYRLDRLKPLQHYTISVWATSRAGSGNPEVVTATTLSDEERKRPVFTTINVSSDAINVTWWYSKHENDGNYQHFGDVLTIVQFRRLGNMMWSAFRNEDLKKRFVLLTHLVAGEVYEIRLTSYEGPDVSYPKVVTEIKRIRMGPKTDIPLPTLFMKYKTPTSLAVKMTNNFKTIQYIFVKYKIKRQQKWMLSREVDKAQWINIENLILGETYELQLIARGSFGEIVSITKNILVGQPLELQLNLSSRPVTSLLCIIIMVLRISI